jgi:hypothetical protein
MRVSKTRVPLDTIIAAFSEGATAEEIAYQYPVVPLADIYAVIGYYLHRKKNKWINISNAGRKPPPHCIALRSNADVRRGVSLHPSRLKLPKPIKTSEVWLYYFIFYLPH